MKHPTRRALPRLLLHGILNNLLRVLHSLVHLVLVALFVVVVLVMARTHCAPCAVDMSEFGVCDFTHRSAPFSLVYGVNSRGRYDRLPS